MTKLAKYYPYEWMESPFVIDYESLYAMGVRGLIFDIDNTLVPHGAPCSTAVVNLFTHLHQLGFTTLLLSNNSKTRVEHFNGDLNSYFIYDAEKPSLQSVYKALDMMQLSPKQVVLIGDQIFTDICAANEAQIPSILVKYIGHEKCEWKGFRRYLETLVLITYKLRKKYQHRLFSIESR